MGGRPYIFAQIGCAARSEMALTLEDALVRRTQVLYRDLSQGLGVAERVGELMAAELGWSEQQRDAEVERYRAVVAANRAWRRS